MFPDAKTERGQKHLRELATIAKQGLQAVILFAILHTGIQTFEVARQIDAKYADLFEHAANVGVKALRYKARIVLENQIPTAMLLDSPL